MSARLTLPLFLAALAGCTTFTKSDRDIDAGADDVGTDGVAMRDSGRDIGPDGTSTDVPSVDAQVDAPVLTDTGMDVRTPYCFPHPLHNGILEPSEINNTVMRYDLRFPFRRLLGRFDIGDEPECALEAVGVLVSEDHFFVPVDGATLTVDGVVFTIRIDAPVLNSTAVVNGVGRFSRLGASISSAGAIVAGSPWDSSSSTSITNVPEGTEVTDDTAPGYRSGAVHSFYLDDTDLVPDRYIKSNYSPLRPIDLLGHEVHMDLRRDLMVASARRNSVDSRVEVFRRMDDRMWIEYGRILNPSGAALGSARVGADGNIYVGVPQENRVAVYGSMGGEWGELEDDIPAPSPSPDGFGFQIEMDRTTMIVLDRGSETFFWFEEQSGAVWALRATHEFAAPAGDNGYVFSTDGRFVAIVQNAIGEIYELDRTNSDFVVRARFTALTRPAVQSVHMRNGRAAFGLPMFQGMAADPVGRVYVATQGVVDWVLRAVPLPADSMNTDFGAAVHFSTDALLVGAPDHEVFGDPVGAVHVYQ